MDVVRIISVNVGRAAPLRTGHSTELSGIVKRAVEGPVDVRPLGLDGDEQADPTVHGGLTKAVYAYPLRHYPFWNTVRAQAGASAWGDELPHGALGENLTFEGPDERGLWIGDRLRFTDCELAVSEPRQPCHKFAAVMGFAASVKLMVQSGFCGAYLAVIRPGTIRAGDEATLQPGPREVNVLELFRSRMGRG